MKWRSRLLKRKINVLSICKKVTSRNKGVALILTLFILLTLLLLGLALLMQTDTEHLIAVNEQDSLESFHHAEAGLSWTKREVLDVAHASGFTNFSTLLKGPDNTAATTDDSLLGLKTIDTGIVGGTNGLLASNEVANSVIVTKDFGDGSKTYEAFRLGIDEGNDGDYDGPRALVYVRINDNYDDASGNDPLTDTDQIITASVVAEYPIFVDANGLYTPGTRTLARRHLTARFGVDQLQPAIITDRSINFNGNMKLCGECGGAHANVNMKADGTPIVCQNFTATGTYTGNENVQGEEGGGYEAIDVPTINPYHDDFVPAPADFNGTAFSCNSTTPKYYSLVQSLNGSGKGLIYKGYWNATARPKNAAGGWTWRLIDDLNDSNNTILDDCGRVVSGNVNGTALTADSGAGTGVNDAKDDEFYGFKLSGTSVSSLSCSGDVSLCSTCDINENDFNRVDFYDTSNTLVNNANLPVLPGSFDPDGVRDFSQSKLKEGEPKWDFGGNRIYSPIYNAVFFVYGEMIVGANPPSDGICSSTGCVSSVPANTWKVSIIAVNNINVSGEPVMAPANSPAYPFLLVGGRDVGVSGNSTGSTTKCGTINTCTVQAGNSVTHAGIIAAHEQVKINGDPSLDGFIVIEDAVDCSTFHTRSGGYQDFSGNPEIHYDCVNPPNPWAGKVKLTSWEEVQ